MVEKIIENVVNEMIPHLNDGQLEHLKNVLYVNFHGKGRQELIVYGKGSKERKTCLTDSAKFYLRRSLKTRS